jgi:hypothetical protein
MRVLRVILLERGFSQFIVERLGFWEDGRSKNNSHYVDASYKVVGSLKGDGM